MDEEPRYRKMRVMGTDAMVLSSKYSYLCFPLMSLFRSQYLLVDRKCRFYKEDKVMCTIFQTDSCVLGWKHLIIINFPPFDSFPQSEVPCHRLFSCCPGLIAMQQKLFSLTHHFYNIQTLL